MRVTSRLQKAVMEKKLKDQDNVMNWVLSQVCIKECFEEFYHIFWFIYEILLNLSRV